MWVADSEADGLLHEVTKMHCFVTKRFKKEKMIAFCKLEELTPEFVEEITNRYPYLELRGINGFKEFLHSCDALVIHNLFGYDLPLFKKLGYINDYDMTPENIDGNKCRLIDSLSMSRCLYPDRPLPRGCPSKVYNPVTKKYNAVGSHGLHAWGLRVANLKPKVDDWRDQPLDVYVNRCVEDVIINELVLDALIKESQQVASEDGDWKVPMRINNKSDFLMEKQEEDGIQFDTEGAISLLNRIDEWMGDIEKSVNAKLPRRPLPKSKQPTFPSKPFSEKDGSISANGWKWLRDKLEYPVDMSVFDIDVPPKTAFKRDGSLSAAGAKYCIRNGVTDEDLMSGFIREQRVRVSESKPLTEDLMQKAVNDLRAKTMPDLTEPMTISNQQDIKKYLVTDLHWVPLHWRTKDVSRDDRKQPHPEPVVIEKVEQYIAEVEESPYRLFIYDEMDMDFRKTKKDKLIKNLVRKARFLVTTPQFKDDRGDLCENLEKLDGEMAKEIVTWLSLRNRRSVIKAIDEKKETGWLNVERLNEDGRIGQGMSGPTNTNRYKHRRIVNLPKASPDVLLGHEMRALFIAPKGKKILGYDGSNLEQFVAASYAYPYDNGEYAELIKGDAHAKNAKAYTERAGRFVSRGEGKGITYATLYGAGAAKIGKMLGVSKERGQAVIDAFWDSNRGLKAVKEYLESYWERSGKRYIKGIDGRKIYTRSKSSLVNALFQSCGSIIMFLSGLFMYDALKREGLIEQGVIRIAFVHDEYQYEVPDELIETFTFESGFKDSAFIGKLLKVYDKELENHSKGKPFKSRKEIATDFGITFEKLVDVVSKRDECEEFNHPEGKLLSNSAIVDGCFVRYYSRVGVLGDWSLTQAGKYFKLPLEFKAAYDIGNNLAETH